MRNNDCKRRNIPLLLLLSLAICASAVSGWGQQNEKQEIKKKEAEALKDIKSGESPVHFIGKVVDQNGDPVEKATVTYSYEYDGYKKKVTWTSKEGLFEITERGMGPLMIEMIEQEGYDKSFASNRPTKDNSTPRNYEYEKNGSYWWTHDPARSFKQPAVNSPEIFKIRKKGEPTMLLTSGGTSNMSFNREKQSSFSIDVLSPAGYNCSPYDSSTKATKRIDLLVIGGYKDGVFNIKFKAIGEKGAGLIFSEEKLYAAPENGYQSEYDLQTKQQYDSFKPLYLYCRTGEPLVYSMLKLEINPSDQSAKVKFYSSNNPYGERNFEQGRYMYSTKKIEALKDEAWKALEEKKYPPKPDFKALEEEGKQEYLRTHKINK